MVDKIRGRDFESEVQTKHLRIYSYLEEELETHANVPPLEYILSLTQWPGTSLHQPSTF